ncbi:hypothetical protein FAVG1_13215 [Fusarium avenaceum]|nr:hypothetical protein FAVG1_13215 [Fusarium avenaceum]
MSDIDVITAKTAPDRHVDPLCHANLKTSTVERSWQGNGAWPPAPKFEVRRLNTPVVGVHHDQATEWKLEFKGGKACTYRSTYIKCHAEAGVTLASDMAAEGSYVPIRTNGLTIGIAAPELRDATAGQAVPEYRLCHSSAEVIGFISPGPTTYDILGSAEDVGFKTFLGGLKGHTGRVD